jgi:hypothetical protein
MVGDQMQTDPRADELRTIERTRLQALVDKDLDLARTLHADDFLLVSPGGRTFTRAEYMDSIADGLLDYVVFQPEAEIEVLLSGNIAALRYIAHIQLRVSGELQAMMRVWHTDVYERRDGQWQDVSSQATLTKG